MKQELMEEWVLRDEILAAFHRWPIIVIFVLLGSLLGLVIALLWPSPYKASTEISVELNPYRALDDRYVSEFAGVDFRNIDDYKHWQMSQLSILVVSDAYLEETLNRLREKDSTWQDIDIRELRDMVEAEWRNAGKWLLNAEAGSSQQAKDVVEIWQDVIIEKANASISQSRELFGLELDLRALNDEIVRLRTRSAVLEEISRELNAILVELEKAPPDEPIDQTARLGLSSSVSQVKDIDPAWEALIGGFPAIFAPVQEFIDWIGEVNAIINEDLNITGKTLERLESELAEINSEWESTIHNANGLSATLSLENLSQETTDVNQIRPIGLAALVGGLFGLLIWFLVFFAHITRRGYRR